MALGLYLRGSLPRSTRFEEVLSAVEAWFRKHAAHEFRSWKTLIDSSGSPIGYLSLFPGAECVEFSPDPSGDLAISASTSAVGPGYHANLCSLVRAMGVDLSFKWRVPSQDDDFGDETGYFDTQDEEHLKNAMLEWLGALLHRIARAPGTHLLCMPLDCGFRGDSEVLTQLGPRTREWAEAGARNPVLAADFWPWPDSGPIASKMLGQALTLMWCEVKWRKPWRDDERACLQEVADLLEQAYQQDQTLSYPWREWLEVLGYLERQSPLERAIHRAALSAHGPLLGYRRTDVTAWPFRGWSLIVPGGFATEYTDDDTTWHAWDETRVIWFSALRAPIHTDSFAKARQHRTDSLLEDSGDTVRNATVEFKPGEEGAEAYYLLSGEIAVPGRIAYVTVTFDHPDQRKWAEDVWRSVQFTP